MKTFSCALLLSAAAWAGPSPDKVVERVYLTHWRENSSAAKTIRECEDCFTPGFIGAFERAQSVDFDVLTFRNGGWRDFKVDEPKVSGNEAIVNLHLLSGWRNLQDKHGDPKLWRNGTAAHATVYLIDLGRGFQIRDFEVLPQDGLPRYRIRPLLEKAARR